MQRPPTIRAGAAPSRGQARRSARRARRRGRKPQANCDEPSARTEKSARRRERARTPSGRTRRTHRQKRGSPLSIASEATGADFSPVRIHSMDFHPTQAAQRGYPRKRRASEREATARGGIATSRADARAQAEPQQTRRTTQQGGSCRSARQRWQMRRLGRARGSANRAVQRACIEFCLCNQHWNFLPGRDFQCAERRGLVHHRRQCAG